MNKMKSEKIIQKVEELIEDVTIKVISRKIIFELDNVNYFMFKNSDKKELICGGIIYIASIKAGNHISINDIETLINYKYKRKILNHEIKKIKRALGMKYCEKQTIMGIDCILLTTPETHFLKLCKKENSSQNIINTGIKIAKKIEENPLFQSGANPINISGGIFYIASIIEGEKITQRNVSDKINISEVTMRKIFHTILKSDKILEEQFNKIHRKRINKKVFERKK